MSSRILSGTVLGVAAVAMTLIGGAVYNAVVIATLVFALVELILMGSKFSRFARVIVLAGVATVFAWTAALLQLNGARPDIAIIHVVVIAMSVVVIVFAAVRSEASRHLVLYLYALCVVVGCLSLILVRQQSNGVAWTLVLAGATWGCDIGAYTVGRNFGKTPFMPAISPKKTWEGTIGGLVAGTLMTALVMIVSHVPVPFGLSLVAGFIFSVGGVVGDLMESALKRRAKVKDSGTLIPGHGGVLDRIDSLVIVAVLVYGASSMVG